jgi:FkbM family methyltransferase
MARRLITTTLAHLSEVVLNRWPDSRRILLGSLDEQSILKLVKDYYQDSDCSSLRTIMDVGANTGQSAETYARLFPVAQIYSLEPASEVFEKLCLNLATNKKVTPLRFAASDHDGFANFYHSEFNVASSLNSPWKATGTSELVVCKTIDTISYEMNIRRINILKTDTEGHDLRVLKGAERMLSEGAVDIIIAECGFKPHDSCHSSFYEIADYLRLYDFNLSGFAEAYNFEWNECFSLLYCNAVFTLSLAVRVEKGPRTADSPP